jgi:adenylate cyclase
MSDAQQIAGAWIEFADGRRRPVDANCAMGRSASNSIVLEEAKVSRRHAIIHCQGAQEHWLVDLGSRNGTHLNGRRVIQPTRLQENDQIQIGDTLLRFHQTRREQLTAISATDATVLELRRASRWLLLADVVGSTQMSHKLEPKDLSMLMGQWLAASKEIIERNGGAINKFLGDGFFAYWPNDGATDLVARTVSELRDRQNSGEPTFRVVIHFGEIVMGGASLGEESLIGAAVNKIFRMEKFAGSIGESRLMSTEAYALLSEKLATAPLDEFQLQGFPNRERFYSFLPDYSA